MNYTNPWTRLAVKTDWLRNGHYKRCSFEDYIKEKEKEERKKEENANGNI